MTFEFSPGAWLAPVVDWLNTNFQASSPRSANHRGGARQHPGGTSLPARLGRHRPRRRPCLGAARLAHGRTRSRRTRLLLPDGPLGGVDGDHCAGLRFGSDLGGDRRAARDPRRAAPALRGGAAAHPRHHADRAALGLPDPGGDDLQPRPGAGDHRDDRLRHSADAPPHHARLQGRAPRSDRARPCHRRGATCDPLQDRGAIGDPDAGRRPQPVHPALARHGRPRRPCRRRRPRRRGDARPDPHGDGPRPPRRSCHRRRRDLARPPVARGPAARHAPAPEEAGP